MIGLARIWKLQQVVALAVVKRARGLPLTESRSRAVASQSLALDSASEASKLLTRSGTSSRRRLRDSHVSSADA
ncbi:hypothetical protein PR002_g10383 [Phytophthora rubi]|uniref:Uncharacterized protein n=1 Tax=Phytophthora rubi TaxID=129364 RepID=A0A6A3M891_9STRA|nr:hypothetical protein PR002_g10383 [Phytophthora rubi]